MADNNPLRVTTAPRRWNPWNIVGDRWIILYWDPFLRLHFVFRNLKENCPWYFTSKEEAIRALVLHGKSELMSLANYEPKVYRYECLKEFEDHQHRVHDNLQRPVIFFGTEEAIKQVCQRTRVATISARDPMVHKLGMYGPTAPTVEHRPWSR